MLNNDDDDDMGNLNLTCYKITYLCNGSLSGQNMYTESKKRPTLSFE